MKFTAEQSKQAIEFLNNLIQKKRNIEIKQIQKCRTNQQNRYLHLILNAFAIEFGYSLEEVKQGIFKIIVNPEIFKVDKGDYWYIRSTADLDSKELTDAIQRFRIYSSKNGFYLAAPDEFDLLIDIENHIEKYSQYL